MPFDPTLHRYLTLELQRDGLLRVTGYPSMPSGPNDEVETFEEFPLCYRINTGAYQGRRA